MGKVYTQLDAKLIDWIELQKLFFVSTAPLSAEGHINCSPKGMDAFRVMGPQSVAYLDLTGSGVETIAHLKENGRIVVLFCAFDGSPKIVRLHGTGRVFEHDSELFRTHRDAFPDYPGARAIVWIELHRISDSCGYSVPRYTFKEDRDTLLKWAEHKGLEGLEAYRRERNTQSLDGLTGFESVKT